MAMRGPPHTIARLRRFWRPATLWWGPKTQNYFAYFTSSPAPTFLLSMYPCNHHHENLKEIPIKTSLERIQWELRECLGPSIVGRRKWMAAPNTGFPRVWGLMSCLTPPPPLRITGLHKGEAAKHRWAFAAIPQTDPTNWSHPKGEWSPVNLKGEDVPLIITMVKSGRAICRGPCGRNVAWGC